MTKYRFSWACGFMGETDYRVSGAGDLTMLRVRREASDYQRSISTLTEEQWQRDVVGAIGLLVDGCGGRPVPDDLVAEFNAWRDAEYWRQRNDIDAQPERYGVIDWDTDAVFAKPAPVRGARYVVRWEKPDSPDRWKYGCTGLGWHINGEPAPVGGEG